VNTNIHPTHALSESGFTILYVEDEPFVQQVTCEVLRAAGYRVLAVRDSADAMRVYESMPAEIDVLLTDVVLPGKTGPVLASTLRRQNPCLKVLYVTGYANQMIAESEPHSDWLPKPFSSDVLLCRLQNLFRDFEPASYSEAEGPLCDAVAV